MGDKSCYPCSKVVESTYGKNLNWVQCFVLPNGSQILGETDIRKSAIIISFFSEMMVMIRDENTFFAFIEDLNSTFSQCSWFKRIFSLSLYFKQAQFWDYKEKMDQLFRYGLLYPLELVIYSLYKNTELKTELFIKYFISSLAESTNRILQQSDIYNLMNKLSYKDIELLLALDIVRENVQLDILDDNYLADLFDVDSHLRYPLFIDEVYYIYYVRDRAEKLFLKPTFRSEYMTILKKNFRALENQLRKGRGFESVGSFFMEKLLFDKLRQEFPELTILSQHSPDWLSPQRFDIFIDECNLAIEYNGEQHFRAIGFFGGENGFKRIRLLDERKKTKCTANSTFLFEIRYDEDFDVAVETLKCEIKSLLL